MIDHARIGALLAGGRADGRRHLAEPVARELLAAMGIAVPGATFVPVDMDPAAACEALSGSRVVVRVVARDVLHKTEAGGVAFVARTPEAVRGATAAMLERLGGAVDGWLIAEHVVHDGGVGGSLLVSARWTDAAGPVVCVGAGGVDAEALARDLAPGRAMAVMSPGLTAPEAIADLLGAVTAVRLATTPQRGRPARLAMEALVDVVARFGEVATAFAPADLLELEVNPLVVADGRLVALDALVTLGDGRPAEAPDRPRTKLGRLLQPRSTAIAGVSGGMNAGRTILRNLLRDGFDLGAITVIKPGTAGIDGVRCVPDVASLPAPVDMLVVALAAGPAASLVIDAIERDAAETIVLVAGGLEEKRGTEDVVARMHEALRAARRRPGGGPLINGGNCLGIRSVPGRYDTLFIPGAKLPPRDGDPVPLVIVAQSGAFAITRLGRLADLHPRYLVTVGNQMDVTIGDYVEHFAADPSIAVVGVYVEGFRPLDAARTVAATHRIVARGGTVVAYLAGRTEAGSRASASHTASIAGDRTVERSLLEGAGAIVAPSLDDFDDLVRTATLLVGREPGGRRLGAISNAGFECVAIADAAGSLRLERFAPATVRAIADGLVACGADEVVDVHNPLDVTPMAGDRPFVALAEAVVTAAATDVAVVGIVPLAAGLATLPAGPTHDEDLATPGAVAAGLVALWRATTKPWVAVVDAGPLYDPFAAALASAGLPVFRTADRAVRALEAVVVSRLRGRPTAVGRD